MTAPCTAVAVSGGVDSLYALVSLHRAGHKVMAVHGRFLGVDNARQVGESGEESGAKHDGTVVGKPDGELYGGADGMPEGKTEGKFDGGADGAPGRAPDGGADPVPLLAKVCHGLGIPFYCLDFREIFDKMVVAPFVQAYAVGQTPNPCALCNASIKFGMLLDVAREHGATRLATGHYARVEMREGVARLYQGADPRKDQSYFLALVPPQRLACAVFPLARMHKADIVRALAAWGVPVPLPAESQEICFVPQDAYRPFVQAQSALRGIALSGEGPVLLNAGTPQECQLGRHKGLWQYTQGQRRGLGIAYAEPLYVAGKDASRNALLLCTREHLTMRACTVRGLNIFVPRAQWPTQVFARVRYKQNPEAVEIQWDGETELRLCFPQGQSPTAPGQVAALYDAEGGVLAGGLIAATE